MPSATHTGDLGRSRAARSSSSKSAMTCRMACVKAHRQDAVSIVIPAGTKRNGDLRPMSLKAPRGWRCACVEPGTKQVLQSRAARVRSAAGFKLPKELQHQDSVHSVCSVFLPEVPNAMPDKVGSGGELR